jgi:hypothetical protein
LCSCCGRCADHRSKRSTFLVARFTWFHAMPWLGRLSCSTTFKKRMNPRVFRAMVDSITFTQFGWIELLPGPLRGVKPSVYSPVPRPIGTIRIKLPVRGRKGALTTHTTGPDNQIPIHSAWKSMGEWGEPQAPGQASLSLSACEYFVNGR